MQVSADYCTPLNTNHLLRSPHQLRPRTASVSLCIMTAPTTMASAIPVSTGGIPPAPPTDIIMTRMKVATRIPNASRISFPISLISHPQVAFTAASSFRQLNLAYRKQAFSDVVIQDFCEASRIAPIPGPLCIPHQPVAKINGEFNLVIPDFRYYSDCHIFWGYCGSTAMDFRAAGL